MSETAAMNIQTHGSGRGRTKRAFWSLYLRETSAYFNTPAAYIVAIVFLLITGYFFAQPLFARNQAEINDGFVGMAPLLLTFFIPAITMRHFAEEYKVGTMELLMTLPVEDWEILAAKFSASFTLLAATLAFTLIYPVSISFLGQLDFGAVVGAYLGLLLSGALLISVGLFASSLTRNQIIAFIFAFLISFVLFVIGKVSFFMPLWLAPVTDFLGLDSHLDSLSRGVVDTRDLLYYLSLSGLFLYLCQVRLWLTRSD